MVAARLGDAIEAGETALSNFEARGNRWWAGRTLWLLSAVANYRGDWGASLAYCRRGLEHGIALDDLRLKAAGWTRIGNAYLARGDTERALECCDRALALSPLARDAAWARAVRGYGRIRAGDLDRGIAEMQEALAWFESSHMRWTQVIGAVWLAEGHLRRGDRATAQPLIDRILNTSRATGYLQYEGRGCWLMAECLARDAPLAAEDFADAAIRIFQSIGARNDLAKAMITCAALRQRQGDAAAARQLLADSRAIFEQLGTLDDLARADNALAALDPASPSPFYTDIAPPTLPSSLFLDSKEKFSM
jgi:tetratricopeptide (TPR) repeat protein